MRDINIRIFEQHAREYDAWFEAHAYAHESEVGAVQSLLPRSGRGLEVGVGTGRFAVPLGITVGVEPAHAMASVARQRGIEVCEARAEELPFANESFDFVVMVTAICFLRDALHALQEARGVLKVSGHTIIGMIDKDSSLGKVYEAKKSESRFYRYAHFYSVTQVIEWLRDLGYEIIRTCQTIFKNPEEMTALEPIKDGHGEGGFVVISAQKEVKS
jgi:ubiquinone/menaquinone biosynthesis C-methylase UbiE